MVTHQPQTFLAFWRYCPLLALMLFACKEQPQGSSSASASTNASRSEGQLAQATQGSSAADATPPPRLSHLSVSHGLLDQAAPPGTPELASISIAATVYKLPQEGSEKLGYLRLG